MTSNKLCSDKNEMEDEILLESLSVALFNETWYWASKILKFELECYDPANGKQLLQKYLNQHICRVPPKQFYSAQPKVMSMVVYTYEAACLPFSFRFPNYIFVKPHAKIGFRTNIGGSCLQLHFLWNFDFLKEGVFAAFWKS